MTQDCFQPQQFLCFFFNFFGPCCTTYGILVPHQGIEPIPPGVKAWSPHHWTTREVFIFKIHTPSAPPQHLCFLTPVPE